MPVSVCAILETIAKAYLWFAFLDPVASPAHCSWQTSRPAGHRNNSKPATSSPRFYRGELAFIELDHGPPRRIPCIPNVFVAKYLGPNSAPQSVRADKSISLGGFTSLELCGDAVAVLFESNTRPTQVESLRIKMLRQQRQQVRPVYHREAEFIGGNCNENAAVRSSELASDSGTALGMQVAGKGQYLERALGISCDRDTGPDLREPWACSYTCVSIPALRSAIAGVSPAIPAPMTIIRVG
jgi:hypothetical protein